MRKARMVPPRRPRLESVKTTIALQDKQIKMLIDRCETLQRERAALVSGYEKELAYSRLLGWQDCVRELMNDRITVTGE